jgi:hypothetical protein
MPVSQGGGCHSLVMPEANTDVAVAVSRSPQGKGSAAAQHSITQECKMLAVICHPMMFCKGAARPQLLLSFKLQSPWRHSSPNSRLSLSAHLHVRCLCIGWEWLCRIVWLNCGPCLPSALTAQFKPARVITGTKTFFMKKINACKLCCACGQQGQAHILSAAAARSLKPDQC